MNRTTIIIIFCLVLLVLVIVISCVLIRKEKPKIPTLIRTKQNAFHLTPSYKDQIYLYELELTPMTSESLVKSIEWDETFMETRLKERTKEMNEKNVKTIPELLACLRKKRDAINVNKPREQTVLALDHKMLERMLGAKAFDQLVVYAGPTSKWKYINLWVNNNGYTTPMHGDISHGFALHLTGKKRWVFANKKHLKDCYATPNFRGHLYCKASDPYNNDLKEIYPDFKKIRYLHTDIKAGEMLNVPVRMLHFVHTLETCCMVSIITYLK